MSGFSDWWVKARNATEAVLTHLWHEGVADLTPVLAQAGKAAAPAILAAGLAAKGAIEQAASNGTPMNSGEMFNAGISAVKAAAPSLEASVGTAVLAAALARVEQAAAQSTGGATPPPVENTDSAK